MKKEREGVIWALLTDEERAEMPDMECREQWYPSTLQWGKDNSSMVHCAVAYRPRPKPVKKYRPWTPEEAVGKVVRAVPGQARMITGACMNQGRPMYEFGSFTFIWDYLIDDDYRQLDGSPCGVEVDA